MNLGFICLSEGALEEAAQSHAVVVGHVGEGGGLFDPEILEGVGRRS